MHRDISESANKIVTDDKFLLALGGEHSISSALVRAVKSKYDDLSVLQTDAHADLRESYQSSKYSHASVMRRIHDMGVPFVGVGIRSYSREEASYLEKERVRPVTA